MKFSLWLERREKRNQKSATKQPRIKSNQELALRTSKSRIHDMAGQGDSKTYGRSGSSDSNIYKGSRSKKNRDAIRSFDH
jgi:hypothetical protein